MWVKQTKIWILTFNIDPFGSTGGAEKEKKNAREVGRRKEDVSSSQSRKKR